MGPTGSTPRVLREDSEEVERGLGGRALALGARLGPRAAGSILPFALIVYLGLRGGGYDAIVRSEAGIAAWWIVLMLALASLIPSVRFGRSAWIGLGVLAALAAWTALSMVWSESPERSFEEAARVATYLGVLVLALALQGRDGLRRTLGAVGAAIAVIGLFALLSRLSPELFPTNDLVTAQPADQARLSYPLNHWNAVAALMGIGLPLIVVAAANARHLISQALATAAIPIVALVAFYTLSRSGWAVIAVGLIAMIALYPRRLALLPTVLLGALGSGLCIAAASQRQELQDGNLNATAFAQGDEMLAMVLIVCAGVALLRVAVELAMRSNLVPRPPAVPRRMALRIGCGAAVLAIGVVLVAGAPGELSDRWQEFKRADTPGGDAYRLQSASGNGRYQYWESAVAENSTAPLIGTGAGTFAYWWAREGDIPGFTRYAHSLYLEVFGELGIVGLLLVLALIALVIGESVRRGLRGPPAERALYAGALGGCCAFVIAVGVDWAWQMTVIPVAFLIIAGAVLAGRDRDAESEASAAEPTRRRVSPAWVIAGVAVPCLLLLGVFAASATLLNGSEDALAASEPEKALSRAESAGDLQPFSASPALQAAIAHGELGELDEAVAAATTATEKEPTNWRTWWALSETEHNRGNDLQSLEAWEEARSLNPRSPLLSSPEPDFG